MSTPPRGFLLRLVSIITCCAVTSACTLRLPPPPAQNIAFAVRSAGPAQQPATYQPLPFAQDWSNTALITADDNWSGVPGIIGYLGDGLTAAIGANPQTIVSGAPTTVDVIANRSNPNTLTNGGVAEFHLADPAVALQGSATADAPHLVLHLDTTGWQAIVVQYTLRDLDGSDDDAVQPVALQYRIGESGDFINVPAGFVADATTGPNLATLVTTVSATLPSAADQQPRVQVRIITSNAPGSDEWVGVDDIQVTGTPAPVTPAANLSVGKFAPIVVRPGSPITYTLVITSTGALDADDVRITDTLPAGLNYVSDDSGFAPTLDGPHVTWAAGTLTTGTTLRFTVIASPMAAFEPTGGVVVNTLTATTGTTETVLADNFARVTTAIQPPLRIRDIQGATHISPYSGTIAYGVPGIVTAVRTTGFYVQDPEPDDNPATSEGLFVFTGGAPGVAVGDSVVVSGTVGEFRPNSGTTRDNNLTLTQLSNPALAVRVIGNGNPLPAPIVIGSGGRPPPTMTIDDDAVGGNVENGSAFEPDTDGLDFYESLEGMRVQVNDAVAIARTTQFGGGLPNREVWVLADGGADATTRTARGGIIIAADDFNPERILVSNLFQQVPDANVGDRFVQPIVGVLDYNFSKYQIYATAPLVITPGGLTAEAVTPTLPTQLSVATFNVENLDPTDPITKFNRLASVVVNNLQSPDVIAVEEIQDNDGPANTAITDASLTWSTLITAIVNAGGPLYSFRDIAPQDDRDGGEPGGNIRVGFLFRTDRGLAFVDRPGGTATAAVTATLGATGVQLSLSPGRIEPTRSAFNNSRKPLVGEFNFRGQTIFIVANHFNSKGGDQPLFGRFQPPIRSTEVQRAQQAQMVNAFVRHILSLDPNAKVIALGDFNDFPSSNALAQLTAGGALINLMMLLPATEHYSYIFEGNSQALDYILVSPALFSVTAHYDIVHVNSEFTDQVSDHDPQVARFSLMRATYLPIVTQR